MPTLTNNIVNTQSTTLAQVTLEPAHTMLTSLVLMNKTAQMPGMNEWVEQTAVSLTPEQKHNNLLVMEGLYHAVEPDRSWASYPNYVENLAQTDPYYLRQKIFNLYERISGSTENGNASIDIEAILATPGTYLDYLFARFPENHVNVQIETEAYALLKKPAVMRETIVNHLQDMWTAVLEREWHKQQPMLQSCVNAFQQISFANLNLEESIKLVVGKELQDWCQKIMKWGTLQQIRFTPSPHIGPYVHNFKSIEDGILWITFGAHIPQGTLFNAPDLSRSDLLVRVNALADDTRLRILQLIKEEGELCSQDIRDRLDLSQSAGSRHLKQLSATGYLIERRVEGGKCYDLNRDRIEDTLNALSNFLS